MGSGVSTSSMVSSTLAAKTAFEKDELDKLKKKFMELAAVEGNPATITEAQLKEALTFVGINESDTGLLHKIFSLMDTTDDGNVFFADFVVMCSHMLTGDVKEKLNFAFDLYADETGQVTPENMEKVLGGINSSASWFGDPSMSAEEISALVKDIIEKHDATNTGKLNYAEFMGTIVEHPNMVSFVAGKGSVAAAEPKIVLETAVEQPAEAPAAEAPAAGEAPAAVAAEAPAAEAAAPAAEEALAAAAE